MTESHTKGVKEGLFCAVRAEKCDCGNEYKKNCQPEEDWGKYPQDYTTSIKDDITKKVREKIFDATRRSHEAHHIACVAAVTGIIAKDNDILDVVHNTKWCINDKRNMIALPMWAHTIMWYCSFSRKHLMRATIMAVDAGSGYQQTPAPPPLFADLPQHDYDHGRYIEEVDEALKEVLKEVKKLAGKHEEQKQKLEQELNNLVDKFQSEIRERGKRCNGTHAAWNWGMNISDSEWYLPFSMAKTSEAERRIFACMDLKDDSTITEKILDVAMSYWREGAGISVTF